jgi:hypothetical protein
MQVCGKRCAKVAAIAGVHTVPKQVKQFLLVSGDCTLCFAGALEWMRGKFAHTHTKGRSIVGSELDALIIVHPGKTNRGLDDMRAHFCMFLSR